MVPEGDASFWGLQTDFVREPGNGFLRGLLADYCLDHGLEGYALALQENRLSVALLDDYDWGKAFEYAGERPEYGSCDGGLQVSIAHPSRPVPSHPFSRMCVREVVAHSAGENDGNSWLCVGQLYDGRWFALKAWCDYTGWD